MQVPLVTNQLNVLSTVSITGAFIKGIPMILQEILRRR